MNLDEFENQCRTWLEANATPKPARGKFSWGDGDDSVVEIWSEHNPVVDAVK